MKTPRRRAAATIRLRPIGVVESPFRTVASRCDYTAEARVRLYPEFAAGLAGLEYFSHVWVVYHQHRADAWLRARGWSARRPLIVPRDDERAGQGIFSLRAPCRPAALGSCIVALARREDATLVVRGLDAIDGTPVVDVKPYVPQFDAFPDATVPRHWAQVMDRANDLADGSRSAHWDTTNADFALGQRAGLAVLARLGLRRGADLRAVVRGSAFLAQGFEMSTGCSPLRGALRLEEASQAAAHWQILVRAAHTTALRLSLTANKWADAADVFGAKEEVLWTLSPRRTSRSIRRPANPAV